MPRPTTPTERFNRVDEAFLRQQANRADPRAAFYRALLESSTYDEYIVKAGPDVILPGYKAGPISARDEFLYSRRNGWIEDA